MCIRDSHPVEVVQSPKPTALTVTSLSGYVRYFMPGPSPSDAPTLHRYGRRGPATVSYTHLDVYKRQLYAYAKVIFAMYAPEEGPQRDLRPFVPLAWASAALCAAVVIAMTFYPLTPSNVLPLVR